jgi:glycosyltransferase involved in cell wall biosynthesis
MTVIVAESGIGFPGGASAATARISCYARGLSGAGHEVRVLCLGTSEAGPPAIAVNTRVSGVADGIPFEYTCGATIRGSSFWRRRWHRAKGLAVAARRIRGLAAAGSVGAVFLYSSSLLDAVVLHFVARSAGAVYIVDLCELPYETMSGILFWRLRQVVHNRTFFRWFDGVVAISAYLEEHARRFGRPGLPVVLAPVMVDTDEFRPADKVELMTRQITYCGMLNQRKDGVGSLLAAFAGLAADTKDVTLNLVGDTYVGSLIPEFRAIAERLGITDRVRFVGNVDHSETPGYLSQATVLALARPRTPQNDAGMPTKVAEYLASGVPVVVTRTGAIGALLEDGVSAFLVPPDDDSAFEARLRYVLAHPDEASDVGKRGRELAVSLFDYRVVGARVEGFISELRQSRHPGRD